MTDPDTDSPSSGDPTSVPTTDGRDVRGLLLRGTLAVLAVLAVVALFQFYTSALAVIDQWISREYRPLLRAAFNLVVLFAAGIGISLVVRDLTDAAG